MSAKKFLDKVKQLGLLDDSVLAELQKQAADAKGRITAELLAKTLVDRGHLTRFQATKLVSEVTAEPVAASPDQDDLLGLAPLEGEAEPEKPAPPPARPAASVPVKKEPAERPPAKTRPKPPPAPPATPGLTPLEPISEGLTPLEPLSGNAGGGLTPLGPAPSGMESAYHPASSLQVVDDGLGSLDAFGAPAAATVAPIRKKPKKNPWESPLILLGGGGFLLLCATGAVLFWSLMSGSAADTLNAAEEQYKAGAYSQAIQIYDKFLANFPDDEMASAAKVRRGLARIRQAVEVSKDPEQSLKVAKEVLPEVESEPAFGDARPELATLLPDTAAAFANLAKGAPTAEKAQEYVDRTEEALALVNNASYLPTSLRQTQESKIGTILEDVALAKREIDREKKLKQAIVDIGKTVESGDPVAAFTIYKTLLGEYPALESNPELRQSVLQIAEKERELVKSEPFSAPVSVEEKRPAEFSIVLANRSGKPIPGADQGIVFELLRGSVYALRGADGQMLWRRFLGYETTIQPIPVTSAPGADVILCDQRRHEVLRLKSSDGSLVWKAAIGEPFATPTLAPQQVLIPTESGKLVILKSDSGEASQAVKFTQGLSAGPGVHPEGKALYQPGSHSNLYVLAGDPYACREVFFVGHRPGSIQLAPTYIQSHLLAIENAGRDFALVHVMRVASGEPLSRPQEPLRLKGNVRVAPAVFGRRAVIVTDLGALYVLDVDAAKDTNTVTIAASLPSISQDPLDAYPVVDQAKLWLADRRITRYDIQLAQGKLVRVWIDFDGDTFVAPLQRSGDAVVAARRPAGSAAVVVGAMHGDSRDYYWQSELAVPAGYVTVDAAKGGIQVVSATGALFAITKEVLANGYNDTPFATAAEPGRGAAFTMPIPLEGGKLALFNPHDDPRLLIYDRSQETLPVRLIKLPSAAGRITAAPIGFAGGILVGGESGQVFLIDPLTGSEMASPFQPPIEAGTKVNWQQAALLPGGKEAVLTNDRLGIYRIAIQEQPQRRLLPVAESVLEVKIESPLAALGEHVYGMARGASGDMMVAIPSSDFKGKQEIPLQGRVLWGPVTVGEQVLVQTDSEGIVSLAGGSQRWTSPAPAVKLAGTPAVTGTDLVFATVSGTIWRVAAATGQEVARVELGEPIASGPVVYGSRLLVCGADGAVHVVGPFKAP